MLARRRNYNDVHGPYAEVAKEKLIPRDYTAADRTILADERTFLVDVRTALTLVAAGVTFIHFFESVSIGAIFYRPYITPRA